jgi:hypothetical protein
MGSRPVSAARSRRFMCSISSSTAPVTPVSSARASRSEISSSEKNRAGRRERVTSGGDGWITTSPATASEVVDVAAGDSGLPTHKTRASGSRGWRSGDGRDTSVTHAEVTRSDDHEQLVERARAEERSVSAELRVAIREHLRVDEGGDRDSFLSAHL